MSNNNILRVRPKSSTGAAGKLHGEFRASITGSALTTIAAGTTTAGHVFAARWSSTTGKKCLIRYLAAEFTLTTAFGAAQSMGLDAIVARAYTASHTGGTAIDMGSTLTNSGKLRTNQDSSLFAANAVRIGGAGALTAGTQTLDSMPLAAKMAHMGAVGAQLSATFIDATGDGLATQNSALELGQDEGIVIRNIILMGASGVGNLVVSIGWDEVTL